MHKGRTFISGCLDMPREGLESLKGDTQFLAEALALALLVTQLHAVKDAANIPLKAPTQQQVCLIKDDMMHPVSQHVSDTGRGDTIVLAEHLAERASIAAALCAY